MNIKWLKLYLVSLLLCLIFAGTVNATTYTEISGIRASNLGAQERLVFDLSGPIQQYHPFILSNPSRLVIDFSNTKIAAGVKFPGKSLLVKDMRSSIDNDRLRTVLDLNAQVIFKAFSLSSQDDQPNRLVVDLSKKAVAEKIVTESNAIATTAKPAEQSKLRNVVIVIDPGHGGKDPGATGSRGTHEKDVVLAVSKDLAYLLNKQPGFTAKLTRNADYFISLRDRLAIERHLHADMFIAIHADAYPMNRYAQGASVFALSKHGATSEAARWLAQQENESELGHTLANLSYQSDMLKSVLLNLAQTAAIGTSLSIGDAVIKELQKVAPLHRGFVEQAAFVVLKEPDVPSLLVESGFISNPREEAKLINPNYRKKIAYAVMQGIVNYYKTYPPPYTWLSEKTYEH